MLNRMLLEGGLGRRFGWGLGFGVGWWVAGRPTNSKKELEKF